MNRSAAPCRRSHRRRRYRSCMGFGRRTRACNIEAFRRCFGKLGFVQRTDWVCKDRPCILRCRRRDIRDCRSTRRAGRLACKSSCLARRTDLADKDPACIRPFRRNDIPPLRRNRDTRHRHIQGCRCKRRCHLHRNTCHDHCSYRIGKLGRRRMHHLLRDIPRRNCRRVYHLATRKSFYSLLCKDWANTGPACIRPFRRNDNRPHRRTSRKMAEPSPVRIRSSRYHRRPCTSHVHRMWKACTSRPARRTHFLRVFLRRIRRRSFHSAPCIEVCPTSTDSDHTGYSCTRPFRRKCIQLPCRTLGNCCRYIRDRTSRRASRSRRTCRDHCTSSGCTSNRPCTRQIRRDTQDCIDTWLNCHRSCTRPDWVRHKDSARKDWPCSRPCHRGAPTASIGFPHRVLLGLEWHHRCSPQQMWRAAKLRGGGGAIWNDSLGASMRESVEVRREDTPKRARRAQS